LITSLKYAITVCGSVGETAACFEASAFAADIGVGCALGVRLRLDVASGEGAPTIAAGLASELAAEFEVDWGVKVVEVADAEGSGLCASARDPKIAPVTASKATIRTPRRIAIAEPLRSPILPEERGILPRGRIE
jgi:hypothetical protein